MKNLEQLEFVLMVSNQTILCHAGEIRAHRRPLDREIVRELLRGCGHFLGLPKRRSQVMPDTLQDSHQSNLPPARDKPCQQEVRIL